MPADKAPWLDTGIDLSAGQYVTLLTCGRVYLSRLLDIWVGPRFQLWVRVGADGQVFRGTRDTHSFVSETAGRLYLASYFPGEWATRHGELATDPAEYKKATGGLTTLCLPWPKYGDLNDRLAALGREQHVPGQLKTYVAAELERLRSENRPPRLWKYLWFLGDSEIFQAHNDAAATHGQSIKFHTQADVGILQYDASLELTPDTELAWEWCIERLPSDIAEDTLPTHDYLSIAVEFDNGQDITWHWSAELLVETIYTCPLPTWAHRETHIVIRIGQHGLGQWQQERRNVYEDCVAALGEPAARITRVWLIANSLFQRQPGDCEYRNVKLISGNQTLDI